MASTTFVVNNGAAVAKTFTLQSQDLKTASYINTESSLSAPQVAVISHDLKPTGAKGNDRHNVSFKTTLLDSVGVAHTISCSLQLSVPRSAVVTDALVLDAVRFTTNYLTDARVASLGDGVTP